MRALLLLAVLISACLNPPPPIDPGPDAGVTCSRPAADPQAIDFGCVARQSAAALPWPHAGMTAGDFDSTVFTLSDAGLTFLPTEQRDFVALIPLYREGCIVGHQRVLGAGVDAVLRWSPSVLDFGYVRPGATREKLVTFTNCSLQPVELTNLLASESTSSPTFGVDAGMALIPGAVRSVDGSLISGELSLGVRFTPTALGPRQGQFIANTPIEAQPMVAVPLRGVGGGPLLSVTPNPLDFGAVTVPTTRVVTISNVGTAPMPPDPRGHLFLGVDGGLPYFELTPGDCAVVTLGPYDPAVGVSAGASTTLSVELVPVAAPRTCTLRVFAGSTFVDVVITAQ